MEEKSALLGTAVLLVVLFSLALRPGPVQATVSTVNIAIAGAAFSPSTITVVIGVNNSVRWTNTDAIAHTATAIGSVFSSGTILNGQSFTFVFNNPGSFAYYCQFHAFMTGTVTVLGTGISGGGGGGRIYTV